MYLWILTPRTPLKGFYKLCIVQVDWYLKGNWVPTQCYLKLNRILNMCIPNPLKARYF